MLVICSSRGTVGYAASVPFGVSGTFLMLLTLAALPGRSSLLSLPITAGMLLTVAAINEMKIAAVGLPVTAFDVKMLVENPSVLPNAVGLNPATLHQRLLLGALVFAGILAAGVAVSRRYNIRIVPGRAAATMALMAVITASAGASLRSYARLLPQHLELARPDAWRGFWLPESQVNLSRRLGTLEYLALTQSAGAQSHAAAVKASLPGQQEILRAAAELRLPRDRGHPTILPNLVFLHAESTFDPNAAFHLSSRAELPLWSVLPQTKLLSPLRVNVVGGGSWVTEFEVLTGVDSRVFGYQGFYTHFYIAPLVRNSFVKYLAQRGYRSVTFYPAEGSFYNTEKAFRQYGFDDFVDADQLGLPADWASVRDTMVIRAVIERGVFDDDGPFFYFISTTENHGPHGCSGNPNTLTLTEPASPEETCRLNEYFRRAGSTSAALQSILHQLNENERRTGRPFLLLVYGDHLPWSFTGGVYSVAGGAATAQGNGSFSRLRTGADEYQTFFHVLGSHSQPRHVGFETVPPAWFLPTMVSSFLAGSVEDLYMPMNVYLFSRCGSDFLRSECATPEMAAAMRDALLNQDHLRVPDRRVPDRH